MYYGPDHRSHSGIGKATALSLADRGAHVLVGGRDAACGDAVVAPIPRGPIEEHFHTP